MVTAIDTETTLPSVIEPVPRLVSVAVAGAVGRGLFVQHDPRLFDLIVACLRAGATFANAPFDITTLLRWAPALLPHVVEAYQAGRVFDVLTRAKMLDVALGRFVKKHNLGTVAKAAIGLEVDKNDPWRLRYEELLGLEIEQWPEGARRYAQLDADATLAIHEAQDLEAARYSVDLLGTQATHARAHLPLYCQTIVGFRTDPHAVRRLDQRLEAQLDELARVCFAHGLVRWGGTKKAPKPTATTAAAVAVLEAHCAARGIEPARTDKGAISLDEDAMRHAQIPGLDDLLEPDPDKPTARVCVVDGRFVGHPLDAFRRMKSIRTIKTGKVDPLRRPVVRFRYNELVDSGRTSSSAPNRKKAAQTPWYEWCGFNGQNQSRVGGFRECLVPDPGHVLIPTDYSGAELVSLADVQRALFGSSSLGDAIDAGQDVHARFGARILGLAELDLSIPEHKSARQAAKPWNFGKPGGLGAARFQAFALSDYGVYFELEEIRRLGRLWLQEWPEMRRYFDWVDSLESGGRITMIHPTTGYVRGGMRYTEACNFPFQHAAAMGAKEAGWWLWLEGITPGSPLYGCPQKLFVHDEYVTQVPEGEPARCPAHTGPACKRCGYAHERLGAGWILPRPEAARDRQEQIMIWAFGRWCPRVRVRVESSIRWRYGK